MSRVLGTYGDEDTCLKTANLTTSASTPIGSSIGSNQSPNSLQHQTLLSPLVNPLPSVLVVIRSDTLLISVGYYTLNRRQFKRRHNIATKMNGRRPPPGPCSNSVRTSTIAATTTIIVDCNVQNHLMSFDVRCITLSVPLLLLLQVVMDLLVAPSTAPSGISHR